MVSKREIEDTNTTIKGLCGLARKLGYKDPFYQLTNDDGSVVGDMLLFFEDNPGAIEAVLEWASEHHGTEYGEEDDEEEYEEEVIE